MTVTEKMVLVKLYLSEDYPSSKLYRMKDTIQNRRKIVDMYPPTYKDHSIVEFKLGEIDWYDMSVYDEHDMQVSSGWLEIETLGWRLLNQSKRSFIPIVVGYYKDMLFSKNLFKER